MKMMRAALIAAFAWLACAVPALAQNVAFSVYVTGLPTVSSFVGTERMVVLSGGMIKTLTPNQILGALYGDCTSISPPQIICTKTNGVAFAASATTDTTNANNIGSGTLNTLRLPSPFTSGTASGNTSQFATVAAGTKAAGDFAGWDASGNINDGGTPVRVDAAQSLNSTQQAQGRVNLGINQTTSLAASVDFNTVTSPGTYQTIDALSTNAPVSNKSWILEVWTNSAGFIVQRANETGVGVINPAVYERLYTNPWQGWQQLVILDTSGRLPAVDGSQLLNTPSASVGAITLWPNSGGNIPANNFIANGAAKSRTTYSALFNVLVKSATVAFTNGSAVIGWSGNTLSAGDKIKFYNSGGALPTNFTAGTAGYNVGTEYCVLSTGLSSTQFEVAATCGGTAITAGSAGTGTQTAVNAPWGDGDGSTTFTLPNLVGDFPRFWQDGTGSVDQNRQFGAEQLDAFQGHYHSNNLGISSGGTVPIENGTVAGVGNSGNLGNSGTASFSITGGVTAPSSDGTDGTPRTAAETRPRNMTLLPIIRYQ